MPDDNPNALPFIDGTIVWPTDEQREKGLAALRQYVGGWKAAKGLVIDKPSFALVVSLDRIEHDQNHFSLVVTVEDVIRAAEDFDSSPPLRLTSVWNAPNLSITAAGVRVLYSLQYLFLAERG